MKPTISTFSVTKGGKVLESFELFSQWDIESSLDENLERFKEKNPILASNWAWLKEMRRIFRVRFGDTERHKPLILLAQSGLPMETWAPILLWHLCYRELLLTDFLESWLYPRKQEGMLRVRGEDVRNYLATLPERFTLEKGWAESTISKMSSSLPMYAADFGLLKGKTIKEIVPYFLSEEAMLYVLHDLAESSASSERIINDRRWRRFLLSREELEQELLRLHQLGRLSFDVAGSVVSLELPHKTVGEYVKHLVG